MDIKKSLELTAVKINEKRKHELTMKTIILRYYLLLRYIIAL